MQDRGEQQCKQKKKKQNIQRDQLPKPDHALERLSVTSSPQSGANPGDAHHLQSPHSANPDLDLALHALHIIQLDPLPPAPPGWFSPEKEQLLRHSDGIIVPQISTDISAQFSQSKAANNRLAGLGGPMAPMVVTIKPTGQTISLS